MATQSTEVTEQRKPTQLEQQFTEYLPQIKAALPGHVPVERFKRVVLTAINQNPDLAQADRRSLFTSCVQAAQDGLLPDGKEAALVIYNTKVKGKNGEQDRWEKRVQYLPMIAGVRKRMRNSGEVLSAVAHVVYENDDFTYVLGDEERIEHKPAIGKRGKPIAAYAIIKLANGETLREVMPAEEVEQARSASRAKDNGPWVTWWGEMARKTVLRRCAKAAPTSADIDQMFKRDDELEADEILAVAPPPRPTRAQYHIEQAKQAADGPAPFTIWDRNGIAVHENLTVGNFASTLMEMVAGAETEDDLHGLAGNNQDDIDRALPLIDAVDRDALEDCFARRIAQLSQEPREPSMGDGGDGAQSEPAAGETVAAPAARKKKTDPLTLPADPSPMDVTAFMGALAEKLDSFKDETAVMDFQDRIAPELFKIDGVDKKAAKDADDMIRERAAVLAGVS